MNFADTPQETVWRQEVRGFLKESMPKELHEDGEGTLFGRGAAMREWRRRVATKGWIAPALAEGVRRRGLDVMEQFIFNEEFARAGAPARRRLRRRR